MYIYIYIMILVVNCYWEGATPASNISRSHGFQVRLPDVTAFFGGHLDLKSRFPSSGSPGKAGSLEVNGAREGWLLMTVTSFFFPSTYLFL